MSWEEVIHGETVLEEKGRKSIREEVWNVWGQEEEGTTEDEMARWHH